MSDTKIAGLGALGDAVDFFLHQPFDNGGQILVEPILQQRAHKLDDHVFERAMAVA